MSRNKKVLKPLVNFIYSLFIRHRKKVFCLSVQRNGTTSCGKFLKDHGYRVAGYGNHSVDWSYYWLNGDYEKIFRSITFKSHQAFEDNPWWMPDFYKYIYHRFPKAKFILFYRNSEDWYKSMLKHSGGKVLGNTYRHCKVYDRLDEYYEKLDKDSDFNPNEKEVDNLMDMSGMKDHYTRIYDNYNREVIEYFKKHAPGQLFYCELTDDRKWQKLGGFLKKNVADNYNIHLGKSK